MDGKLLGVITTVIQALYSLRCIAVGLGLIGSWDYILYYLKMLMWPMAFIWKLRPTTTHDGT